MKILIVQNISRENPGLIEEVLKERGYEFDIVDLSKNQAFPNPSKYDAVFVFGGPDSANDRTPKMLNELQRIKEILGKKIPYFGVCLGLQTLVKTNGGQVYKNHIKEIGFRDPKGNYFEIELTDQGKSDPIFNGIKSFMKIFHLHGETVKLNSDMKLLATGKFCKNQVVKIGKNAYGFQGHIELTASLLNDWIEKDQDLRLKNSNFLRKDYQSLKLEYQNNSRIIINNFLQIAGLKN